MSDDSRLGLTLSELESFIERIPAALHVKGLDGRYRMANRIARRNLSGGDPDAVLVGTSVGDHLPAAVARSISDGDATVIATLRPVELEVPISIPGEPVRWYLSVRFPLADDAGAVFATGGLALDITERKAAQEEIVRLNTTLEEAVHELDTFAYSVSHDLRAPLRSMVSFSRLLAGRYASTLDETGQDYLHRIQAAGERMTRMIDDLLGLSRMDVSQLHIQRVDVTRIASDIIADLSLCDGDRKVCASIADGLEARADPGLLTIVLQNLLSNAWKYTAQCDVARIEVGAGQQTGSHREFFVRDNGAGFDMAYARDLFIPFRRLHSGEVFSGTGIGLATTRRAVTRQGGRIWATSAPGEGATFTFTMPVARPAATPAGTPAA